MVIMRLAADRKDRFRAELRASTITRHATAFVADLLGTKGGSFTQDTPLSDLLDADTLAAMASGRIRELELYCGSGCRFHVTLDDDGAMRLGAPHIVGTPQLAQASMGQLLAPEQRRHLERHAKVA